jgi:hypothetical protein
VPANVQGFTGRDFIDRFGDIVFSKVALSRFINVLNRRYGFGFANCDQFYTIQASLCLIFRLQESGSDPRNIFI